MNKFESVTFFIFAYWHDPRWKKFVGATVKIWDLAHNLSSLGHPVTIFLPKYNFKKQQLPFKIIEIPFLDFPLLRSISFSFFLVCYLIPFLFINRPCVVYARRMGSIIPGIYAKLIKVLFFYEINDDPYRKEYHEGCLIGFKIRTFISELLDHTNLKLCNKAFAITPEIREKILNRLPKLPAEKISILPSGANTDLFKPLSKDRCRSQLNLDPKKRYIGFAGTLLKHQGIDTLIDAAPSILDKEPSCTFLIIGEGPTKKDCISKVKYLCLDNSFLFTGQVDYELMPTWLGATDICVAPFLETAGLRSPVKIFDYMACGRQVVASEIKGTTDMFANSGAVKFVLPGNVDSLSNAIINSLQNCALSEEMGEKGRSFILDNYDRKSIAKQISDDAVSFLTGR